MEKYYSLNMADTPIGPVAYSPEHSLLSFELIPELENKNQLPFDFTIKKVTETKKGIVISENLNDLSDIWDDYLPNNTGVPLMSLKLKAIIDNNVTEKEFIDWITCRVFGNNLSKEYYILRFNKPLDVLDLEKTKFIEGTDIVINPCFSNSKVMGLNVFTIPTSDNLFKINLMIFVNHKIKEEIEKQKLTGIEFGNVRIM